MQRLQMIVLIMCATALISCVVHGAKNVSITVLESARSKGAVCLDGSPPSYAFNRGFGNGVDNWHVHLQGGGWCWSSLDCFNRSLTNLGSSTKLMTAQRGNIPFDGLLENNATFNPDFYNWNVVFIFYCDGSSFMSNVEEIDPVYNITYRGARIYDAVMEELLVRKGMRFAKNALLSGSSAGGLAAILHCDKFRALFPNDNSTRVKCLSDSGFFIQGEGFLGADWREILFFNIISTHGLANLLPKSCLTKFSPTLCLFSENLVPDVQTPLFLIESSFDQFQISALLFSPNNITKRWFNCTNDLMLCNWTEFKIMQDFQTIFINTLKINAISDSSSNRGYFVHSCYRHVHILTKDYSTCSSLIGSNILAGRTVAQAVGDWYLDRSNFQEIDTHNDLPRNCSSTYPGQPSGPDFDRKCSHAIQLSNAPPKQLITTYFFFIIIIGVLLLISHVNVYVL